MLTMVFTDLVDSTSVKAALPGRDLNERNRTYLNSILEPHRERIEAVRARFGGRLVDQIGDSFFLVFESVSAAAHFAVAVQMSHADEPIVTPLGAARVRIGMHTGDPIPDPDGSGRLVGHEVDYAARLCSLAEGGQVTLSDATASLLRNAMLRETRSHPHGDRHLKGIGLVPVFELLFEGRSPQPLREGAIAPDNLAPPPTRVTGRTHLLADLRERLHLGGVVVLKAEGGMGKTTLGLALAHEMLRAGESPGGTCWVNCETRPDLTECLQQAAGVFFGDRSEGDTSDALSKRVLAHLQTRRALLILDNFETVADDATLVRWLSSVRAPARVLVTTREVPPGMPGRVVPVLELSRADAVALFRARALEAGVAVPAPEAAVDALCALVGDQPLGVVLLAVRSARTPAHRLLDQLRKGLAVVDASGDPTRPDRHQSARACVTGSFDELSASARRLLLALCVLPSGFGHEVVGAVAGDDDWDRDAAELVDASLWRFGGELYTVHPLVRQYACERLGDTRGAAERRAAEGVARTLLERSHDHRPGPGFVEGSKRYLAWCADHLPNVIAAVELARAHCLWRLIPDIARATEFFWNTRGHWPVAERLGEAVLEAAAKLDDPSEAAFGYANLGFIYRHQGRDNKAIETGFRGLAVCDANPETVPPRARGMLLAHLGKSYLVLGRFAEADSTLLAALSIFRAAGDRQGVSLTTAYLGQNTKFLSDWERAESLFGEALVLARAESNLTVEREILYQLGDTQIKRNKYADAQANLTRSAELARMLDNRESEAKAVSGLGLIAFERGDLVAARDYLLRALAAHRESGFINRTGRALRRLGQVELAAGNRDLALRYAREAIEVLRQSEADIALGRAQAFLESIERPPEASDPANPGSSLADAPKESKL